MNQEDQILEWLLDGNALTPLEALQRFGCFRLGARVYDLKQRGHEIESKRITTPSGKSVAEYRMVR